MYPPLLTPAVTSLLTPADLSDLPAVTPKFLVTPSDPTEAVAGQPLLLDCQAYGRPEPSVQWDKNSRLNDFDESRSVTVPGVLTGGR